MLLGKLRDVFDEALTSVPAQTFAEIFRTSLDDVTYMDSGP
jgi:hypothetical protein